MYMPTERRHLEKTCNYTKNWTQNVTLWAENWQMMRRKTFWKNDIGFDQPPSPSKMSLFNNAFIIWYVSDNPPPFCTMSFSLPFIFFLKSSLTLYFWASLSKNDILRKLPFSWICILITIIFFIRIQVIFNVDLTGS